MSAPNIFTPTQIREWSVATQIDGKWLPARPEGWYGMALRMRLRAAWLVFTGRADVLQWEGGRVKAPADSDSKVTILEPGAPERDEKKGSADRCPVCFATTRCQHGFGAPVVTTTGTYTREQAGSTPDETLREALAAGMFVAAKETTAEERATAWRMMDAAYRALATPTKPEMQSAKEQYDDCEGDKEPDPIERLRFFCSFAIHGQDWLDVEPFFDAIAPSPKAHEI